MKILMITDRIPYPAITGAPLRINNLLRRIAREHEVWLASLIAKPEQALAVAHFRDFCAAVETACIQPASALDRPLEGLRYLFAGKPPDLRFYYSQELAMKIRKIAAKVRFDIAQIELTHMGLYLEALPPSLRERSLWMLHDIDWNKFARISNLETKPDRKLRIWLHSRMLRRWKPQYAGRFKRCVTVSENDRRLLLAANPRLLVDVVPNGVDTKVYQPLGEEGREAALLFVGNMGYRPCVDAVVFFCREVLPRIQQIKPNVEMWIVGTNPSPEVRELDGNGVHVTGMVEDVRPYYARSTVCVVPLRAGGGTRLKILEAMALGRPVVSTSIGSEGLDLIDGEHLLIADSPEEFADKTLRLLTDKALSRSITTRARDMVASRYDWDVIAKQLIQVYAEVAR